MLKNISLALFIWLAAVAAWTISVNAMQMHEQAEFVQVSVLAEQRADYSADRVLLAIPAVSQDIIADSAFDRQAESAVPVITYTSLPTREPRADKDEDEEWEQDLQPPKEDDPGTGASNGNANPGNNGQGNGIGNGTPGGGNSNAGNGTPSGTPREDKQKKDKDKEDKPEDKEPKPDKDK